MRERLFGERRYRFGLRKLSVGLVSATLGAFMVVGAGVLPQAVVQAEEQVATSVAVDYQYVLESELTEAERALIQTGLPETAQDGDTIYFVYRPDAQVLPKTGDSALLASLALGAGFLLLGFKLSKNGKYRLLTVLLVTGAGTSVLAPESLAEMTGLLSQHNHIVQVAKGQTLPKPLTLEGYTYVGYLQKSAQVATTKQEDSSENASEVPKGFPTVDLPDYDLVEEAVSDNPPMVDLPTGEISEEYVPTDYPTVDLPDYDLIEEAVSGNPPMVDLPTGEISEEYVPIDYPTVDLPDYDLVEEAVSDNPPTVNLPDLELPEEVVPTDYPTVDLPDLELPEEYVPTDYPTVNLPEAELPTVEDTVTTETSFETVTLATYTTEYVDDATMWSGDTVIERQGQNQTETRETIVTKTNGQVTNTETRVVGSTELINELIRRGTKTYEVRQRQETEVIPFDQITEEDSEHYRDEESVVKVKGVDGLKEITVTEKVDRQGNVLEVSRSEAVMTKQPVTQVISVGTKEHEQPKEKPRVMITNLEKDDLGRRVVATYQLLDPDQAYISAKAQLYSGNQLVREVALTSSGDSLNELTLDNLDYYKEYTLKTILTYDQNNGQGQQSEVQADTKVFDLVLKKITFKDIDDVALYKVDGLSESRLLYLDSPPADLSTYMIKIKSDRFKEMLLPVSSVTETEQDGQPVYKVTVSFGELVQEAGDQYVSDYSFYITKASQTPGIYTSFRALVDAMKADPAGNFVLGADLSADEVPVVEGDKSYIAGSFTGSLTGEHNGKKFAIFDLKNPLFDTLNGATVQHLDLRDVVINSHETEVGALAKLATKANLSDIAVSGTVVGKYNVGGVVSRAASGTVMDNISFEGAVRTTSQEWGENLVGGLVGFLKDSGTRLTRGAVNADISVHSGNGNTRAGALAGIVNNNARLLNSYATGTLTANRPGGLVGGLIGSAKQNGRVVYAISKVKVTNGNQIHGDSGYTAANISQAYAVTGEASGTVDQWTTELDSSAADEKITQLNVTATTADSGSLSSSNLYTVDYSTVTGAKADRMQLYENMEKLLPFYNKEVIVYYANKLADNHKLARTALIDVVPMVDHAVAIDVNADKTSINKLLLHYADNTVDYLDVTFKEDFKNNRVAEYDVTGLGIIYTPEQFLSSYDQVVNRLSIDLSAVTFDSAEVRKVVKLESDTDNNKLAFLYLEPTFNAIKADLSNHLRKVLAMDKAINTEGTVVENYLVEKIKTNKEAFLLGLSYLNRWYNINFGDINTKDLSTYKFDFFGKTGVSTLDTIISLGQAGYEALHAKNNITTFNNHLATAKDKPNLHTYLDSYRQLFLPNKTNNEWLKENSKAYIVEVKSNNPEAREKQDDAYGKPNNKYSVGVYDKITASNWRHQNMLLPLLTLTDESLYVISNLNTISFGGYERYHDGTSGEEFIKNMRAKVDQAALWQANNADFWYSILPEEYRDRQFRSVANYEGFEYKDPSGSNKRWRDLTDPAKSIQEFFGPISKYYRSNGSEAYADGELTHFVVTPLLSQYGTSVYTHEMVHNSDGSIYLEGNGRREGVGAETYALGLLQSVDSTDAPSLGLNMLYVGDKDSKTRLHAANPAERFKSVDDLNQYVHGMFDVIYMLDYLEGTSVLKQPDNIKKEWLQVLGNFYIYDKDNKTTHAGNHTRSLTDDDLAKLKDFNSLVDMRIINRRSYGDNAGFARNGYYKINLFSPIYGTRENDFGAPGDIVFRRMAYEMLAAKGYDDGFIPYTSNKLAGLAFDKGLQTWSNWHGRYIGKVTDELILETVFDGKYQTWADFKKDMYKERIDQLTKLKPITFEYELGNVNSTKKVTISSYKDLEVLMDRAVASDALDTNLSQRYTSVSWVNDLKTKLYNAYLRSTDDFRESIFEK